LGQFVPCGFTRGHYAAEQLDIAAYRARAGKGQDIGALHLLRELRIDVEDGLVGGDNAWLASGVFEHLRQDVAGLLGAVDQNAIAGVRRLYERARDLLAYESRGNEVGAHAELA
jgi:hypothetical protein